MSLSLGNVLEGKLLCRLLFLWGRLECELGLYLRLQAVLSASGTTLSRVRPEVS